MNGQKSKEGGRNVEIPQTKVNGKVSEHQNDTFFDIGNLKPVINFFLTLIRSDVCCCLFGV